MPRGFSDIEALDFLTRSEIAARLGYARTSSLLRALRRVGADYPPMRFNGRARGDDVREWAAGLPLLGGALARTNDSKAPAMPSPASPAPPLDFAAARRRLMRRMGTL